MRKRQKTKKNKAGKVRFRVGGGGGRGKGEILLIRTKNYTGNTYLHFNLFFFLLKTYKPPTENSKDLVQSWFTTDCCKSRAAVWCMLQPPATAAVGFFPILDMECCLIRVLKPCLTDDPGRSHRLLPGGF